MTLFRLFLTTILVALVVYTAIVISNHGMNLLAVFFGDIQQLAWPGQFNLDFMFMLALSAIWTAWRHQFSLPGLALAVVAFFGGALFLSIYLLIESYRLNGDARALVLGRKRAQQHV